MGLENRSAVNGSGTMGFFERLNEKYPNTNYVLLVLVLVLFVSIGYRDGWLDQLGGSEERELREGGMPFVIDDGTIVPQHINDGDTAFLSYKHIFAHNKDIPTVREFLSVRDETLRYPTLESTPASFQSMLERDPVKKRFYETVYDAVLGYIRSHDLHPAYENSPGMVLAQIALETGWLQNIDPRFLEYNNILGLKYHPDEGELGKDYFYAEDDCDEYQRDDGEEYTGMCRFAIFGSNKECIDAYFRRHLHKPIYMQSIEKLTEKELKNPLIRMSVVAVSLAIKDGDTYEKKGYATLETYFERIMRLFIPQNNALGGSLKATVFQQRLGDNDDLYKKLRAFPLFTRASSQAKADFLDFVKKRCGYILPNGNRIYYLPHRWSSVLSGYGQDYEGVFEDIREQLVASLDDYQPSSGLSRTAEKAREVYENMRYERVTFEEAKDILRRSHEEDVVPDNVLYMIVYDDTKDNSTVVTKLHRDRQLGPYGKRAIIVHGNAAGYIDADGEPSLSPLKQDLSNLRSGYYRMMGTSSNHLDTYGAMLSLKGIPFQFGYPGAFHGACNGPLSEKVIGVNLSDEFFPIECTQPTDEQSATTMHPLPPEQLEKLSDLLLYYQFIFNTDRVFCSADVVRSRFATLDSSLHLLTRGAHTDDLSNKQRELLDIMSIENVLDTYYGNHGKPKQVDARANALYNSFLQQPDQHATYLQHEEIKKRYGNVSVGSIVLDGPLSDASMVGKRIIAWQRDGEGSLLFPADHLSFGNKQWVEYVGEGDIVYYVE